MDNEDGGPVVVIFRRWKGDDRGVIALFPELDGGSGDVMLYERTAQYSAGDYETVFDQTSPAGYDDEDVLALQAELRSMGYRLRPRQRVHWSLRCARR